ncbi:hypothetical protein IAT38_000359 [Cryptococcus sp. DSM 104549]
MAQQPSSILVFWTNPRNAGQCSCLIRFMSSSHMVILNPSGTNSSFAPHAMILRPITSPPMVDGEEVEVVAALMEDAGTPVEVSELTEMDEANILSLYDTLHSAGIIHLDSGLKHWLRHNTGGDIKVLDFEGSNFVDDVFRPQGETTGIRHASEKSWALVVRLEKRRVGSWLSGMDMSYLDWA